MFSSLWSSTPQEPPFTPEELRERTITTLHNVKDARIGVDLLLDDRFDAAQRRLMHGSTPFHALARGFTAFTIALLGFEEECVDDALAKLSDAETMASQMRKDIKKRAGTNETIGLELDVIIADCDMMIAVLLFLKESMMDYAKAVLRLRRAYTSFESAYKTLHAKDPSPDPAGDIFIAKKTVQETESALSEEERDKRSMISLIESGVLFGRGLFSLILSVLPPKPARALSALGYQGSRDIGLSHLRGCVNAASDDIHAPLAALALLTYHTGLSAFGSYEPRVQEALQECEELIKEMRGRYNRGRMWQLFEGRVARMRGDLDKAIQCFIRDVSSEAKKDADGEDAGNTTDTTAVEDPSSSMQALEDDADVLGEDFGSPSTRHLIQLEYLMEYEHAWCLILTENYVGAADIFHHLANNTDWSRAFYTYIQAACLFAASKHEQAQRQLGVIPVLLKKRFGGRLIPAEKYVERKAQQLSDVPPADDVPSPGAILELAYVFNAFRQLPRARLQKVCISAEHLSLQARTIDEHAIANLLRGAAHRQLGEFNTARKYLSRVLELQDDCTGDRHCMVYAWIELAAIACENGGRWEEAELMLKKVSDYPASYDFENRVQLRVSMMKEAIVEGRKRTGQWPPKPKK